MLTLPRLLRVLQAAVLSMAATSAFANSSQDFGAQVRTHRAEMARNTSAVTEAAVLCTNLPLGHEMREPKCVALRLHMRALAAKDRHESCDIGDTTITHIARCVLGGLPGSAA